MSTFFMVQPDHNKQCERYTHLEVDVGLERRVATVTRSLDCAELEDLAEPAYLSLSGAGRPDQQPGTEKFSLLPSTSLHL